MAVQQKGVECVNIGLDRGRVAGCGRQRDVELFADGLQQFGDGELGVEDVGHMAALRDLLKEAAADGGLAGANVTCEQHKAPARTAAYATVGPVGPSHAVQQVRQRLAVALAHEEVAWVRGNGERVLRQPEVLRIHSSSSIPIGKGGSHHRLPNCHPFGMTLTQGQFGLCQ